MPNPERLLREGLGPFLTDAELLSELTGAGQARARAALTELTLNEMSKLSPAELAHRTGLPAPVPQRRRRLPPRPAHAPPPPGRRPHGPNRPHNLLSR